MWSGRHGVERHVGAALGSVRSGLAGAVCRGMFRKGVAWNGLAGVAWKGMEGRGRVGFGMVWQAR